MTIFWHLNPPELAQPLPERVEQGRPVGRGRQTKKTYPRHLARLLLRARRERPRRRTAEQSDEVAPFHSIRASARKRGSYLPSFQISAASFHSLPIFSQTTRYLPVTS